MSGPVENCRYFFLLWQNLKSKNVIWTCESFLPFAMYNISSNIYLLALKIKFKCQKLFRTKLEIFLLKLQISLAILRFAIIEKNIFVVTAPTINSPITHTNTQWESRHQMKGLITFS